jgi:hypothetical protein
MAPNDPRPDLRLDHDLWQSTLALASEPGSCQAELFWALDGLRCLGARLTRQRAGALRFERGEMDPDEFGQACRHYLLPHLPELRAILRSTADQQRAEEVVGHRTVA